MKSSLDYARLLLKYRPRSQGEIKLRLKRKGYSEDEINLTIDKLKKCGLLDDYAFARYWFNMRRQLKPCAKKFIIKELKAKDVCQEVIEKILQENKDYNEVAVAYELAKRRYRIIRNKDSLIKVKSKLFSFLQRRGFGPTISYRVVDEIIKNEV